MNNLEFLIVTPNLNGGKFIADCLESIRIAFSQYNYKHLIIDGGSTDNSEAICLASKCHNLEYVKLPGSSMYEALNHGIAAYQAEFYYQLNVDDLVLPDAPKKVKEIFDSNSEIAVVIGSNLAIYIDNNLCKLKIMTKSQHSVTRLGVNLYINQVSTFIRKKVLDNIHGYDENYSAAADTELWMRLNDEGYKFKRIIPCLAIDRIHADCLRRSERYFEELKIIRYNYMPYKVLSKFLWFRNSLIYILTQLKVLYRRDIFNSDYIETFGSKAWILIDQFYGTGHSGIIINTPFLKGIFHNKSRFKPY